MAVEAFNNCWTYAEDKLATALPNLAEFLVLTDAADADAAAAHVCIDEADLPHNADAFDRAQLEERATIVIVASSSRNPFKQRQTLPGYFQPSGRLIFYIERTVPVHLEDAELTENQSKQANDRWLKNRIGKIFTELAAYWREHGGPWINEIGVSDGPYHNDPDLWPTEGHYQGAEIYIDWGLVET